MNILALPKIELHLHLDCSLSFEVVKKLRPETGEEEYLEKFVAPSKCTDLVEYISQATYAIDLMQTGEQLRLVTRDLFRQLRSDNVIYAEIRFAPLEHIRKGLSPEQVVGHVCEAIEDAVLETGIQAGLILCTLRNYSEEQSMKTVKLVEQFRDSAVVGFDIAADEAGFPIDNHVSAFEYANRKGLNCTAHAGEACGAESVWETLNYFKPSRIGHGVRSVEDPELVSYLKEEDIHLEVCPTSNIQTNVFNSMSDHSLDRLYRQGISLSINTDGRALSNVTLNDEYQTLEQVFDWKKNHLLKCNLEAADHAFTTEEHKEKLRARIITGFGHA